MQNGPTGNERTWLLYPDFQRFQSVRIVELADRVTEAQTDQKREIPRREPLHDDVYLLATIMT
jgi:hypothetical protein